MKWGRISWRRRRRMRTRARTLRGSDPRQDRRGDRRVASTVAAGGTIFLPRGKFFRWWNPSLESARWICVYAPAGFEKYFQDLAEVLAQQPPGPPDMAKLLPMVAPL